MTPEAVIINFILSVNLHSAQVITLKLLNLKSSNKKSTPRNVYCMVSPTFRKSFLRLSYDLKRRYSLTIIGEYFKELVEVWTLEVGTGIIFYYVLGSLASHLSDPPPIWSEFMLASRPKLMFASWPEFMLAGRIKLNINDNWQI